MPQIVHKDFKQLLAELFNGVASRPATVYMGLRTTIPGAGETLASLSGSEISGGGYARVAIAVNSTNFAGSASGNDWVLTIPQKSFPAFTSTPFPNGATHWFLTDQATGTSGKLYISAPLTPTAFASNLTSAMSAGDGSLTLAAAVGKVQAGDGVLMGTVGNFNPNQDAALVSSIDSSGGMILTASVGHNHANGEPFSLDYRTRNYGTGSVEQVSASIKIVQGF